MVKIPVRKNQIWKNKVSKFTMEVFSAKGGKFKCRVLTEKHGVYNGTHTVTPWVLYKKFDLISDK